MLPSDPDAVSTSVPRSPRVPSDLTPVLRLAFDGASERERTSPKRIISSVGNSHILEMEARSGPWMRVPSWAPALLGTGVLLGLLLLPVAQSSPVAPGYPLHVLCLSFHPSLNVCSLVFF